MLPTLRRRSSFDNASVIAAADHWGVFTLTILYLLAVNAAAFGVFASDKRRAIEGTRRIPERVLLQIAAIGGTPGSITAQLVLRHKTRKEPFRTQLWLIAAAQIVALGAAAVWIR